MCQLIFALTGCRQLQLDTLTGECYESTSNLRFYLVNCMLFSLLFISLWILLTNVLIHIVLYSV